MRLSRVMVAVIGLVTGGCDYFLRLEQLPIPPDAPTPPPPSSWSQVATATDHTCGIRVEGTLWCWGRNDQDQLGAGTDPESDTPQVVPSTVWSAVSAWDSHTCAIRTDHTLWCWGNNDDATLGTGDGLSVATLVQVGDPSDTWMAVGTGYRASCAIKSSGELWCWGNEGNGAVGDGMGGNLVGPQHVASGSTFSEVSLGDQFGCALDSEGAVWCWGDNNYGEIGLHNALNPSLSPVQVTSTDTFAHVAVGRHTACAVTTGGRMRCWGDNADGEVGDDSSSDPDTPVAVDGDRFTDWVDIAMGKAHACGRRGDGSVWCWGSNQHDQLALDSSPYTLLTTPTQVPGGPWMGVAAGDDQTCVFDATRLLWCAGRAGYGQLATAGSRTTPTKIPGTWSDVAAGYRDTCAIDTVTSQLSCWGANDNGTVGDGTMLDREQPVSLGMQTWSGITVGDGACGLDNANALYCWGANFFGEAGDPSQNDLAIPQPVLAGAAMSNVSTSLHTCAIGSQALRCWGRNLNAECGAAVSMTKPVSSPLAGTWLAVAAGSSFSCAIELSGMAIQCWGTDGAGELGDNDSTQRTNPVPTQVPSLPFDRITAGENHACAHTMGGAVYCWGWNVNGQLGDQMTDDHHIPAVLPGTWTDIAAGARFTCGIKQDKSLWCWGANDYGQLGIGTFGEHHEPQHVGSDSDWTQVRAGKGHACARKTDGSLWCWGLSYDGEIGDASAWRLDLQLVP